MPLKVRESFAVFRDGIPQHYVAGELVADDDPVGKSHKHLMTETTYRDRTGVVPPVVEQATSAPGEKRTVARKS